jgi:hypothetical protein
MQAPCANASTDSSGFEAQSNQLLARYHAMLTIRELGKHMVPSASPRQCPHIGLSRGLGGHATEAGATGRACGTHSVAFVCR